MPILDVQNLVPTNVQVAKSLFIVVQFVRQSIGRLIKSVAMAGCVRWVWTISPRPKDFIEKRTGCKHFVTVILQQRS